MWPRVERLCGLRRKDCGAVFGISCFVLWLLNPPVGMPWHSPRRHLVVPARSALGFLSQGFLFSLSFPSASCSSDLFLYFKSLTSLYKTSSTTFEARRPETLFMTSGSAVSCGFHDKPPALVLFYGSFQDND